MSDTRRQYSIPVSQWISELSPTYLRLDQLQPNHPKPEFRLTFDKHSRNLSLNKSSGTAGGGRGENVALEAITGDWIQEAFLKYQNGSLA